MTLDHHTLELARILSFLQKERMPFIKSLIKEQFQLLCFLFHIHKLWSMCVEFCNTMLGY